MRSFRLLALVPVSLFLFGVPAIFSKQQLNRSRTTQMQGSTIGVR
jgi:hypothetical protein